MSENSSIEWTDHTFNPWWGCTKVSPGCDHCYADTLSTRYGHNVWGPDAPRRFFGDKHWADPLTWNHKATQAGVRRRVFCGSMCDWAEGRPDQADARARLFVLIEQTPALDWLLLTKRPGAIPHLIPPSWLQTPRPNVWYGTSIENQEQADRRIPQLLQVPAVVRFLSCEPLLGPVDLSQWLFICELCGASPSLDPAWRMGLRGWEHAHQPGGHFAAVPAVPQEIDLHWVIAGGESGPRARPMHPDWARSLRDQCQAAGIDYFFKQWGLYVPLNGGTRAPLAVNGVRIRDDADTSMVRSGKKAAGRLLDGRTWDQVPEPNAGARFKEADVEAYRRQPRSKGGRPRNDTKQEPR